MEERTDERRFGFDGGQVGLDPAAEGFVAAQRRLADTLALEVVPHELVGVQLGYVARQKVQLEAPLEALDVVHHRLGDVPRGSRRGQGTLCPCADA
jgi:hypothetical protein